ncbi:SAM-dependent DNA methyltransferase [Neorhizobium sp. T786]|uniref:SAM-dependent DNA methyltransferase n=1 Tax=Pseudorhizobium xiangyangii TaxID=2883104 RepID=UPI001CFF9B6B|nr:SAM-dependent DNA methyltransferase [Neorhizobium xiangyangii]MCB5204233.1 SAM-dependent DNA methyltransferase [Neorhizobium xiangyangii]
MRTNHMESRLPTKDALEYFPTPPWATRAVIHELLLRELIDLRSKRARDPCAGGGHMALPLRESFGHVDVSDLADWGINPEIRDFLEESRERLVEDGHQIPDWVFINPPFEQSLKFVLKALEIATEGVALFCRLGWLSGQERYHTIFGPQPPTFICPFAERVALIEGAWDPEASTATDYVWYIWIKDAFPSEARPFSITRHLRPGMQDLYSRLADLALANPGEAARRLAARKAAAAAKSDQAALLLEA